MNEAEPQRQFKGMRPATVDYDVSISKSINRKLRIIHDIFLFLRRGTLCRAFSAGEFMSACAQYLSSRFTVCRPIENSFD